jgi:hypothetical protein
LEPPSLLLSFPEQSLVSFCVRCGLIYAILGIVIRLKVWRQVREKEAYADADFFDVPEDYDFTTRVSFWVKSGVCLDLVYFELVFVVQNLVFTCIFLSKFPLFFSPTQL